MLPWAPTLVADQAPGQRRAHPKAPRRPNCANLRTVTRAVVAPPVCVLGLGLIGGSIMRATAAGGREVFGYNRSVEGAQGAQAEGFDASTDLNKTLARAADTEALIVLAVPMPALPNLLAHISESARNCPLTDVTSVKSAVLDEVNTAGLLARFVGGHPMTGTAHSGWAAGHGGLFNRAPWVISVDDHVDPTVWSMVMDLALDCGAVVVPAKSDEHDAAAAAISHLPHLLAEALAITAAEVPLAFALAAGSFRDATRVAGTAPDLVRAMCEANSGQLLPAADRVIDLLSHARDSLANHGSVADLVDEGHAARTRYESFPRSDIVTVAIGAPDWRDQLAAAGRAGGVIRSALPSLDTPR
ncbi:Prephenate dehydrogenase [Mycobacterium simulans]|uniref:Prephenate dehydrogenase n=1 Tax=Mycobacterium simulans TaxID=627089 RepID=A0A7Z7IRH5_9MYCO|nr:Prephenate dehydrogenase [Mycobacterium simulans]